MRQSGQALACKHNEYSSYLGLIYTSSICTKLIFINNPWWTLTENSDTKFLIVTDLILKSSPFQRLSSLLWPRTSAIEMKQCTVSHEFWCLFFLLEDTKQYLLSQSLIEVVLVVRACWPEIMSETKLCEGGAFFDVFFRNKQTSKSPWVIRPVAMSVIGFHYLLYSVKSYTQFWIFLKIAQDNRFFDLACARVTK